jgi:hypothetical protein
VRRRRSEQLIACISPSRRPEILTVPLPLILPTTVMLELIEETSRLSLESSCNCWTGEGSRWCFDQAVLQFSKHVVTSYQDSTSPVSMR